MLPQQFLRTLRLLPMTYTQITDTTKFHTHCSWMLFSLLDKHFPLCLHCHHWQVPSASELPKGTRFSPTDRTGPQGFAICLPQKSSESCFSAALFYAHPCCRNYTLLSLLIGLRQIYFYLCNVTNLYSSEAQFLAVPKMVCFHYFELPSPFHFASLAGFHFE